MRNRLMTLVWITALLVMVLPIPGVAAQGEPDGAIIFTSASSTCGGGSFEFEIAQLAALDTRGLARMRLQPGLSVYVQATDSGSNFLGSTSLSVGFFGTYSGSITYSQKPEGDVTFWLFYAFAFNDFNQPTFFKQAQPQPARVQQFDGRLADTITVTPDCGPVAGCDTKVAIPEQAVVGSFVSDADVYWDPGQLTANPLVTIEAGKTAWVFGQDESRTYYKILWVCDLLWVPKSTMGPNYDAVWNGAPLPETVVD